LTLLVMWLEAPAVHKGIFSRPLGTQPNLKLSLKIGWFNKTKKVVFVRQMLLICEYWPCCWQRILADKDSIIMELKQQVKNLREDLNIANVDSDRKSVALLTKVCLLLCFF